MKKIVTLIPSASEIVSFLGEKKSIIGRSHECDFPKELTNIVSLTSPKLNVGGSSREIHDQIEKILSNSLSVYKVDIEKLKYLNPDYVITQAQCEVCAVSLSEVEEITSKYLSKNTKLISLQPNTISEVFDDIKRVASGLNLDQKKSDDLILILKKRLEEIKTNNLNQKNPEVACIEWIDPLMVAGNWIPEMVEISGAKDVFGKIGKNSHWIKFEDLIEKNPEIIIFIPCGFDIAKTKEEVEILLSKKKEWSSLKAYQNKKIFIADGNQYFNRPGPRIIESIEILCEIFHPKKFHPKHQLKGWINYFS
tara:strand:+ start:162 stop:1085 length:924 start_codon:yes stop_codon:yes gene_type:complete